LADQQGVPVPVGGWVGCADDPQQLVGARVEVGTVNRV
jgi:hypothetical protein